MEYLLGGDRRDPPKAAAPFYRLTLQIGDGERNVDRFSVAYVPSARAVRTTGENGEPWWVRLERRGVAELSAAVRGIDPLPATKLGPLGDPIPTPKVRVDEVVLPPENPANTGGFPWVTVLLATTGVGLAGAVLWRVRRRPLRMPAGAPSESA